MTNGVPDSLQEPAHQAAATGSWSQLSKGAKAFRITHAVIAAVGLGSVGYVWACALTGRRNRVLGAALAALTVQGIGVLVGRGNCPLGPLQRRLGDPVPFFELVLPPRAAKAAFPVLLAVTLGGIVALPVLGSRLGGLSRLEYGFKSCLRR
jgi:hypothetical protein